MIQPHKNCAVVLCEKARYKQEFHRSEEPIPSSDLRTVSMTARNTVLLSFGIAQNSC